MDEEKNFGLSPKISVIIPVFNAEKYLCQCLDSVLEQSLKDIEVICVDDGSTDSSLDILNKYKNLDSRIIVLRQENLHAGVARNKGIEASTGEYIHFLDADDWIEKDAYWQWYAIAKDKDAEICECLHKYYDAKTGETTKRKPYSQKYIAMYSLETQPKDLIIRGVIPWNKLYKRDFLLNNKIRFDNLICSNDRYFYFQVIFNVKRFVSVKEWWINYRINIDSLTAETRLKNYDCHFKSFANIWKLVENRGDEIKNLILRASIVDFLDFYRKGKGTLYETAIKKDLYNFFAKWDISEVVDNLSQGYIDDYLDIIKGSGKEPILNSLSKIYEKKLAGERKNFKDAKNKNTQLINEYKKEIDRYKREFNKYKKESQNRHKIDVGKYNQVVNSRSYKLGRFLAFPYRKMKGGIKCYKEHGATYTLKRCLQKFANEKSPVTKNMPADIKKCASENQAGNFGLSEKGNIPRIIVSLTSYPPRIPFVSKTVKTLLEQSFKPDKILLWLASEEFPGREEDLPEELLDLKKYGLEICWCANLRSYKKLIPALKLYPEDIIVTADDDVYYDKNWLRLLVDDYEKNKASGKYVYCHRITKFFKPGGEWHTISASKDVYSVPTYLHKLVGIGGVLYPSGSLYNDVLNENLFMSLAPTNDDIWFWFMAILARTKIRVIDNSIPTPMNVEGSQEVSLWKTNDYGENLFWDDFNRLAAAYPQVEAVLSEEYCKMRNFELGLSNECS